MSRWNPFRLQSAILVIGLSFIPLAVMSENAVPSILKAFAAPPASFRIDPIAYESPFNSETQTRVKSVDDWNRRRKEIHDSWMEVMGPWPELLKDNSLEVGATKDCGNYIQQRVFLDIAPQQRASA
ncbi:hypothetical protein OAH08_01310 [Verrucomicrobia bacterium]|nr:hypothetical protein [Verrucomicrobiota bacterium]